ncbi:DUF485 domain-containing protein [Caldibacillus lycopersici]|uniref:DUF485 domain-containing protein n=1 Tax=Perspicuibacillus lycopersici TaxID=1325689 RepID=A0AAE3IRQ5_9BACI|nr:DUF485 domain-containing protein [Perspicuibacillus lycopersici]MCU9613385.1 DUF485 domain-containing protein [Perspicuibacillus lycopersici]
MGEGRHHDGKEKNKFEKVVESKEFKELMDRKKKFIVPLTIFFLVFYFALPILTSYTKILHQPAIGDITWVWIFALAQFIMTWTLVTIYMKKSAAFDMLAQKIVEEEVSKGGKEQ